MPPLAKANLNQYAILYRKVRQGEDAEPKVTGPEEVRVRWSLTRQEARTPEGQTVIFDASMVCKDTYPQGSIVWPGKLSEFDPTDRDLVLYQIYFTKETPSVNARQTLRRAMLMRFRGALPEVVE